MLTYSEILSLFSVYCGVRVARSLVFCVGFLWITFRRLSCWMIFRSPVITCPDGLFWRGEWEQSQVRGFLMFLLAIALSAFLYKGIDAINISNILNRREVVKEIPPYFKNQSILDNLYLGEKGSTPPLSSSKSLRSLR
jgi:hypothetical protein